MAYTVEEDTPPPGPDVDLSQILEFESGQSAPANRPYVPSLQEHPDIFAAPKAALGEFASNAGRAIGSAVESNPKLQGAASVAESVLGALGAGNKVLRGGLGNIDAATNDEFRSVYMDAIRERSNEMGLPPDDIRVMLTAGESTWDYRPEILPGMKGVAEMVGDPSNVLLAGAPAIRKGVQAAAGAVDRGAGAAARFGSRLSDELAQAPASVSLSAGPNPEEAIRLARAIKRALRGEAAPTEALDDAARGSAENASRINLLRETGFSDDEIVKGLDEILPEPPPQAKFEFRPDPEDSRGGYIVDTETGVRDDFLTNKVPDSTSEAGRISPEAAAGFARSASKWFDQGTMPVQNNRARRLKEAQDAGFDNVDDYYRSKGFSTAGDEVSSAAARKEAGTEALQKPTTSAESYAQGLPSADLAASDPNGAVRFMVSHGWDEKAAQEFVSDGQDWATFMRGRGSADALGGSAPSTISDTVGDRLSAIRSAVDDSSLAELKEASKRYAKGEATTQDLVDLRTARKAAETLAEEGDVATARRIQEALGGSYRATEGVKMARATTTRTPTTIAEAAESAKTPLQRKVEAGENLTRATAEEAAQEAAGISSAATKRQNEILGKAIGEKTSAEDLADAVKAQDPSILTKISQYANIPRVAISSFDISASTRQAGYLAARHPKEWSEAFARQLKAITMDDASFQKMHDAMKQRNLGNGLDKLFHRDIGTSLLGAEETFVRPSLDGLKKVPGLSQYLVGIEKSERAFITMLNSISSDVANSIVENAVAAGKPLSQAQKDRLATFINHATGRGTFLGPNTKVLGKNLFPIGAKGERAGLLREAGAIANNLLSTVFFAPRFTMSRWQTGADVVTALGSLSKDIVLRRGIDAVDAEILSSTLSYIASVESLLKLARWGGISETNDDPESAEFQKFDIGTPSVPKAIFATAASALGLGSSTYETTSFSDKGKPKKAGEVTTKIDPWGGFQQNVVLLARELDAFKKQNERGEDREDPYAYDTLGEATQAYLRKKFSPQANLVETARTRRDAIGRPATLEGAVAGATVPMIARDFHENLGLEQTERQQKKSTKKKSGGWEDLAK